MRGLLFVAAVAILGSACKSDQGSGDAGAAASTTTSTAAQKLPFDRLAGNLLGELALEARARPANTPKIEEMVAALRAAGVKVKNPEQGLGSTVRASYCAVAMLESGLGISMCEYPDEKAMAVGRDIAENQYHVSGRSFFSNRTTLLGMRPLRETEQTKKDAQLVTETFRKL